MAYSEERASFERVGTQFEARLQQLRQGGVALSTRRVAEFAASHNVRWGIVRDKGTERDGNFEHWSTGAVERTASTEKPTQDSTYFKGGRNEGRYMGTYAHPIEIFEHGNAAVAYVKVYD